MKTRLIFLLALCFFTAALAQPNPETVWSHYYGGVLSVEIGNGLAQTTDGGFVIAGSSQPMGENSHSQFLRLNSSGQSVSNEILTISAQGDEASGVYTLPDGSGFLVYGFAQDMPGSPGYDAYIRSTFLIGTPRWTRTFGSVNNDEDVYCLCPTDDGGYFLGGYSVAHGSNQFYGYLAKVNSSGVLQSSRIYNQLGWNIIWKIKSLGNDSYIMLGGTSRGNGHSDVFLAKVNNAGDTLWTRTFGGTENDEGDDVLPLSDGGYLVVGSTWSFGHGQSDIYLIRTNADGDSLWTHCIGDTSIEYATSVVPGPSNGFVIAACTQIDGEYDDAHLIGLDATGSEVWRCTWDSTCNNYADRVVPTVNGGYVFLANAIHEQETGISNDIYVIRTGPDMGAGADPSHPELPIQLSMSAYPNPFNSQAVITFALPSPSIVNLDLYDMLGRRVMTLMNERVSAGNHSVALNASGLPSGVYFAHVNVGNSRETLKVVLTK